MRTVRMTTVWRDHWMERSQIIVRGHQPSR